MAIQWNLGLPKRRSLGNLHRRGSRIKRDESRWFVQRGRCHERRMRQLRWRLQSERGRGRPSKLHPFEGRRPYSLQLGKWLGAGPKWNLLYELVSESYILRSVPWLQRQLGDRTSVV